MKKIFFVLAFAILALLPAAHSVSAINLGNNLLDSAATTGGYAPATETSFSEILGSVVKYALSFVGVIFLILMVYAGFLWMTARGDEGQVEKAETIIRSSIIGIVIATAAYSIAAFVLPAVLSRTAGNSATTTSANTIGTCSYSTGNPTGPTTGSQTNVTHAECNTQCASINVPTGSCNWVANP